MLVVSVFTTTTPGQTVHGVEKSYLADRVGLIDTWLVITSKRPAVSPAKIPSNWVSRKVAFTPSFLATAETTSMS